MSCKTTNQPQTVDVATHDTVFVTRLQYDSIFIEDNSTERYLPSVMYFDTIVKSYVKVDTLFKIRKKTEYHYKLLHDTTYIHKTDTIPKVVYISAGNNGYSLVPCVSAFIKILGIIAFLLLLLMLIKRCYNFIKRCYNTIAKRLKNIIPLAT